MHYYTPESILQSSVQFLHSVSPCYALTRNMVSLRNLKFFLYVNAVIPQEEETEMLHVPGTLYTNEYSN